MSNKNERIRQILVIAATVGVIFINYLAGTGKINQITPGEISAKYPTLITPAGYAFSIWALIYAGLIAFSIYQALPQNAERFRSVRTTYILSCVANCAWVYCWHQDLIAVCLGIILLLLGTLAIINIKLQKTETNGEYWLAKAPFGLYFGWVTAATILNAAIALVYLKVQVAEPTAEIIGAGLIFVAAAIGVAVCLTMKNYFYPLATAWASTAIAIKNSEHLIIVGACVAAVVVCLLAAISFVMDGKSSRVQ